ncbi:STAS domain-containing protein [Actinoplanes sp. NPDC049548]|uniref:STAS domain-containing protein n=1 Tax=Actinoplanes sp. NPDC049548 TaxID=3155152 RepID=UPI00341F4C5E
MNPDEAAGVRIVVTEVRRRDGAILVTVTGDLDVETTAMFHRRLGDILDGRDGQRLDLDMSTLGFCDLAGLRALHALGLAGAPVRIVAAGPSLNVLLRLCQISVLLDYTPAPAHPDEA